MLSQNSHIFVKYDRHLKCCGRSFSVLLKVLLLAGITKLGTSITQGQTFIHRRDEFTNIDDKYYF